MLKYMLDTDMIIYTIKSRTCDLMIAGHARPLGCIFVTDNTGEFARGDCRAAPGQLEGEPRH